jgi:hypothetical protein
VSAVLKILTKTDWLNFEIAQWRDAVHDRGLKLESLDLEQRKLVAEAISGASSATTLKALMEPFSGEPATPPSSPKTE